ncbi:hypothetical protein FS837_009204 [Tulasnella sp. UAMH 9824]|nr:hypothetical protein FS837_009204 [Tulasnella sp. UAMH 9824]
MGIESVDDPSGNRLSSDPERVEQYQERVLNVSQQRMEMAKKLIRTINEEVKEYLGPDHLYYAWLSSRWPRRNLPTIEPFGSFRDPDNFKLWLLKKALLLSSGGQHEFIWGFVAKTSIGLLLWFDNSEAPTPNSVDLQDSRNGYRRECAHILSQCFQDMRQHLDSYKFIETVSPALANLENHWARFKDDFTQNPDLKDSKVLTTWLEIRDALDKPEELKWGRFGDRRFGQAYTGLKAGFEAIASAQSRIEAIQQVHQNTTEHPRDAASDGQTGQTEPHDAVTGRTPQTSVDHFDLPLEDAGECREHEDAREPNSAERNEQLGKPAGDANSKPMDEDE